MSASPTATIGPVNPIEGNYAIGDQVEANYAINNDIYHSGNLTAVPLDASKIYKRHKEGNHCLQVWSESGRRGENQNTRLEDKCGKVIETLVDVL